MNVMYREEAGLLISKILEDRLPVLLYIRSASQMQIVVPGYVDSFTPENGLVVSSQRPPTSQTGYLMVPLYNRPVEIKYGEKKELPEHIRETLGAELGGSVLEMKFLDTGDYMALIFTID